MNKQIEHWNASLAESSAQEVLAFFHREFGNRMCLSSSMGAEDMVLTDMVLEISGQFRIFTLDTGRVFPETYDLMQKIRDRHGITLEVFFPDFRQVEDMVNMHGINLFYQSVDFRKTCCGIRKLEPLKRALTGMEAWITGIRKDQTINRFDTRLVEWDDAHGLIKINPLYKWNEKQVWEYIHNRQVPYNALHDKGFPSIGCQPCTRAVLPGEDTRAGRWWWEDNGHKECGLHVKGD